MQNIQVNEIEVNGEVYVKKSSVKGFEKAQDLDGADYCIVRTYSAGVFAGYVVSRNGKEGVVLQARRIWYWTGAASLSQLAMEGTSKPNECKFPCEVAKIELTEIIEVIPCSGKAEKSIKSVPVWEL